MIETGVVFDKVGNPLFWHEPPGRSGGSIPDSNDLWEFLWEHREVVAGVAHSHPGSGVPHPSQTDVQTFSAVERALGKRLLWPIVTSQQTRFFKASGEGRFDYVEDRHPPHIEPRVFLILIRELRRRSNVRAIPHLPRARLQKLKDWCVSFINS